MGISWKKASSNPAGQKKTAMETPWNILGNFMENRGHVLAKFLWKVHGNFIEKASDNPAVKKHPCRLYGTCMEHSWKIVETAWESSCGNFISLKKASNNPAGPKKTMETPCNMPGIFMENRG